MDETDDRGLDGIGGVSELFNGVHNRNDQAETCSTEDSDELNGSASEDGRTGSLTDSIVVLETEGEDGNLILRMLENVEEGGDVGSDRSPLEVEAPFVGMKFSSGVEFVAYMHIYGHAKGFGVRIRDPVKDQESKAAAAATKLGKLEKWFNIENKYKYYRKIRTVCRKAGVHKSTSCDPNRSTTTCRTNCPYAVNACRGSVIGSSWKITMVSEPIPEVEFGCHNHAFNPDLCRHLPRYRRISIQDQIIAMELHRGGVGVANMYDIFVKLYKFYELVPFTETDLRNYIYFVDRKPLKDTDFGKMEVHFRKMREHSPHFFYEFDVDQETNVLRNVFWADLRCIEAFKEFGDVVSFDTTFVTNRYKMPFAPFVGVNHHGKTILLGCALIGKEDAASFSWFFGFGKSAWGNSLIVYSPIKTRPLVSLS